MPTKAEIAAELAQLRAENEQLKAANTSTTRKPLKPGRMRMFKDQDVSWHSPKKNPLYGYINIPEGVTGEISFAIWHNRDKDGNPVPGYHGELRLEKSTDELPD